MNLILKNLINKARKPLTSLMMVGILSTGGWGFITPNNAETGLLNSQTSFWENIAMSQENTLLQPNFAKPAERIKMVITAYSSRVEETDSTPFITASNTHVRDGVVANNLLPFGSKVRIPALYGDKIFTVEDRMSKHKGDYHLDIWMSSYKEAKNFGAEIAYIEVLND